MKHQQQLWIADDDPYYSPSLKAYLEAQFYGIQVEWFKTNAEVVASVADDKLPDAAILDMMLPRDPKDTRGGLPPEQGTEAPGVELARHLIQAGMTPRRIAIITALTADEHLEPLLTLGINEKNILIKPALISDIKQMVTRITAA